LLFILRLYLYLHFTNASANSHPTCQLFGLVCLSDKLTSPTSSTSQQAEIINIY